MPEITKAEQFSGKLKALVFGRYKTGKTAGAATFPRPNFMDFDGGINVLKSGWWQKSHPGLKIIYEGFAEKQRDKVGVVLLPRAFDDACRYFDEWMKPGKVEQFDTWIIDSGTSLSALASNKAVYLLGGRLGRHAFSETHKHALATGLLAPVIQDFGAERSLVEQFVDMVMLADKHLLLLCHERESINKAGAITEIVPLLTGQSVEKIPLKFDEVYRLRVKPEGNEIRRTLQTQPDSATRVGSRLGLPNDTEWSWQAVSTALGLEKNDAAHRT